MDRDVNRPYYPIMSERRFLQRNILFSIFSFEISIQFISLDWAFYLVAILVTVVLLVIWKTKEIGNFKMEDQS